MGRLLFTNNFKDLSWLEGRELDVLQSWEIARNPEARRITQVTVIKNYPRTLLLETGGCRKLISKAAVCCGDVLLVDPYTQMRITGEEVTRTVYL